MVKVTYFVVKKDFRAQPVYEKRLDNLIEQAAALGDAAARVEVVLVAEQNDERKAEAASKFMGVVYSQFFQARSIVEEIEAELSALGLAEKFASDISFIKSALNSEAQATPSEDPHASMGILLQATASMISMQRAIVETRAKELFQEYLPSTYIKPAK